MPHLLVSFAPPVHSLHLRHWKRPSTALTARIMNDGPGRKVFIWCQKQHVMVQHLTSVLPHAVECTTASHVRRVRNFVVVDVPEITGPLIVLRLKVVAGAEFFWQNTSFSQRSFVLLVGRIIGENLRL